MKDFNIMCTSSNNKKFSFKCIQCGHCCKDEGYVFFTDSEVAAAAKLLGMVQGDFINLFLEWDDVGNIYYHEVKENSACAFLVDDLCTIQDAKPSQCSTFPYWGEYMDKDGNIVKEKFNRHCPGMKFFD